jgi:hypothetical protein
MFPVLIDASHAPASDRPEPRLLFWFAAGSFREKARKRNATRGAS